MTPRTLGLLIGVTSAITAYITVWLIDWTLGVATLQFFAGVAFLYVILAVPQFISNLVTYPDQSVPLSTAVKESFHKARRLQSVHPFVWV